MTSLGLVVNDHATAKCFAGGGAAEDVAVAAYSNDRIAQYELDPCFFAGVKFFYSQQPKIGNGFTCTNKELDLAVVFDG